MNGALVFGTENKAAPEAHAIHALGFNHCNRNPSKKLGIELL
jgi:hypothetical protein